MAGNVDVISRAQQGDPEALRQLYDQTAERVYRLLLRMTRNADDAFDLTQETYVQAFERIAQFEARASFSTWLHRIAVNQALTFLRKRQRATNHAAIVEMRPPAGRSSDPAERLDVREALDLLDPEARVLLLLRYQEGLDYRTISEMTGHPTGTVGSKLNRARQSLRDLLEKGYAATEESPTSAHLKDCG